MRITRVKQVLLAGLVVTAMMVWGGTLLDRPASLPPSDSAGYKLVSVQQIQDPTEICLPETRTVDGNMFAALGESGASDESEDSRLLSLLRGNTLYAAPQAPQPVEINRQPVRRLWDTDPSYGSIAFDARKGKVFLQDLNLWAIRVFDRLTNTPRNATKSEPERVIAGKESGLQFNTCMYIDPVNGDIYTVENDVGDSISVFSEDASGNVAPKRTLDVTHRAHTITIDEEKQELFVTISYPPAVEIYRKEASGNEKPIRVLQGESTRLADVHGIALDTKAKEMFVNNWGHISQFDLPGSGRFEAPSITVFPIDAKDDAAPLRVIQGPKTQLDWPGAMHVDPDKGDLYVTNSIGQSILVFDAKAQGDVAPKRVIKGSRTGLTYPTSLAIDVKNQELWVANLGNASATAYRLSASGNVPPLRTIRSAPLNKISLKFGKTQAVTYDTKREEILVPN
jgi:DNA-binding beta-propeller fold protein YncE